MSLPDPPENKSALASVKLQKRAVRRDGSVVADSGPKVTFVDGVPVSDDDAGAKPVPQAKVSADLSVIPDLEAPEPSPEPVLPDASAPEAEAAVLDFSLPDPTAEASPKKATKRRKTPSKAPRIIGALLGLGLLGGGAYVGLTVMQSQPGYQFSHGSPYFELAGDRNGHDWRLGCASTDDHYLCHADAGYFQSMLPDMSSSVAATAAHACYGELRFDARSWHESFNCSAAFDGADNLNIVFSRDCDSALGGEARSVGCDETLNATLNNGSTVVASHVDERNANYRQEAPRPAQTGVGALETVTYRIRSADGLGFEFVQYSTEHGFFVRRENRAGDVFINLEHDEGYSGSRGSARLR